MKSKGLLFQMFMEIEHLNVKNWIEVANTNGILKIQCEKLMENSVDLRMNVDIMNIYIITNITRPIYYQLDYVM